MNKIADYIGGKEAAWVDAAKNAGISAERLREISGGAEASLNEMRRIARALRLPLDAIHDARPIEQVSLLFRQPADKDSSTYASTVASISAQIQGALNIAKILPKDLSWLNRFSIDVKVANLAELLAHSFRQHFFEQDFLSPLLTLPQALERVGVFIMYSRDASIEGVSAIVEGYPFILLGGRSFAPRALFSLAHELGHLVAHHPSKDEGFIFFDREVSTFSSRRKIAEEQFANEFASFLLLPREGFLRAIRAVRQELGANGPLGDIEILTTARFFGVSFEVAGLHCERLGLLPRGATHALYDSICRDHGNPEKRADELSLRRRDPILIETSNRLINAASLLINKGSLSLGRCAELLNVPPSLLCVANATKLV